MTEGLQIVTVAFDEDDGTTSSGSVSFTIDRIPPQIRLDPTGLALSEGALWAPDGTVEWLSLDFDDAVGGTPGSGMTDLSFQVDTQWMDRSIWFTVGASSADQAQPLTLGPGLHGLDFQVYDKAWNRALVHLDVWVNEAAPPPVRVVPADLSFVSWGRNSFWVASAGPDKTVRLLLDGEPVTGRGDIWPTAPNVQEGWFWRFPPDGRATISAEATDSFGNIETAASNVIFDTTQPTVTFVGLPQPPATITPAGGSLHVQLEFTDTGSRVDPASIVVRTRDANWNCTTFPMTPDSASDAQADVPVSASDAGLNVTVCDFAGNCFWSPWIDFDYASFAVSWAGGGLLAHAPPQWLETAFSGFTPDWTSLAVSVDAVQQDPQLNRGDGAFGPLALPDGTYAVEAMVRDYNWRWRTATNTLVVDATPPTLSFSGLPHPPDVATVVGTSLHVRLDFTDAGSGIDPASSSLLQVNSSGTATAVETTPDETGADADVALTTDDVRLDAQVCDLAGACTTASVLVSVQLRTIDVWPNAGYTNWPSLSFSSNLPLPANPASTVITVDDDPTNLAPTFSMWSSGGWGYIGPRVGSDPMGNAIVDCDDGPHTVTIEITEDGGSVTSRTVSFVLDRTPPRFSLNTLNQVTSGGALWEPDGTVENLSFLCDDLEGGTDGSGIRTDSFYFQIDRQWIDGRSDWFSVGLAEAHQLQPITLTPGSHTLDFQISDNAWNQKWIHADVWVNPGIPPTPRVIPPDRSFISNSRNTFWVGSAGPETTVRLLLDGEPVTDRGYILPTAHNVQAGWFWRFPPDGRAELSAEATGPDGTVAIATSEVTFDNTPPTLEFVGILGGVLHSNGGAARISLRYSDALSRVDPATLQLTKVDANWSYQPIPVQGGASGASATVPLAEGDRSLVASVCDQAGSCAWPPWIQLDVQPSVVPPVFTVAWQGGAAVTNADPQTVSLQMTGATPDWTTLIVTSDGDELDSQANQRNGTFGPVSLDEGMHPVAVWVTDTNGFQWNATASLTLDRTPPEWPPGAAVTATGAVPGTVTVSWPAATDAQGVDLYEIRRNGVAAGHADGQSTTATLDVEMGDVVSVIARDLAGNDSVELPVAPPEPPANVVATGAAGRVNVAWDQGDAPSHNLYWSSTPGAVSGSLVADASSPATVYLPFDGTTYYFAVTAVSLGGESTPSEEVTASPSGPLLPAASLVVAGGTPQSAIVGTAFQQALAIVALDEELNVVPDVAVTFTAPPQGASASFGASSATAIATTGPNGRAVVAASAGTAAGEYAVTASANNGAVSVAFALANAAGTPASVEVVSGTGQSAVVGTEFGASLVALVRDAFGNPVANAAVNWTAPPGGTTAALGTALPTDGAGLASVAVAAGTTSGGYVVTASVPGGIASASFPLTNLPGDAVSLSITGISAPIVAGTEQSILVAALDGFGNMATGYLGTIRFTSTDAQAVLPVDYAFVVGDAGSHVFAEAVTFKTAGTQSITATDTVTSTITGTLDNVVVEPAEPTTVTATAGSGQHATVASAFTSALSVDVKDAFGNAVPGVQVAFTAPASGATAVLSDATATTDSEGDTSVTAIAGAVAGEFQVAASLDNIGTTFTLTNDPAAGARIVYVSGGSQTATVATSFGASLVARVTDVFGNAVSGATATWSAPASGSTAGLSAASTVSDASGLVSITATAGTAAGSYLVTASAAGDTATFSLTNTAAGRAFIAPSGGHPQSTTVHALFSMPLAVLVTDAYGNPVSGATVAWAAPESGPTAILAQPTSTTDGTGHASITATAGTMAGGYAVTASINGGAVSAAFSLTNNPGPATTVAVVSGSGQSAVVGQNFISLLVAVVRDTFSNTVPGVTVAWSAPASGARAILGSASPTDVSGQTSIAATAGTVSGGYSVAASINAGAAGTTFAMTNVPESAVVLGVSGIPATVTAGTAQTVSAIARDAFGNVASGYRGTVHFTSTDPQAVVPADHTFTAEDAGAHVFNGAVALKSAGARTLAATDTVTPSIAGTQSGITVVPAPAAIIAVTQGNNQHATVPYAFATLLRVRVDDAHGNAIANAPVTFTTPESGARATLSRTFATTDAAGTTWTAATANTVAGACQVTASTTGVATPAAFILVNDAGTVTSVTVVSGDSQSVEVGTAFPMPLAVRVRDTYGNLAASATVTFLVPGSGATAVLSAPTAQADSNGVASITATAGMIPGSYSASAYCAGRYAGFPLTNLVGSPATMNIASGDGQSAGALAAYYFSLCVQLYDVHGNYIPGRTVDWTVYAGSGTATMDAPSSVTNSYGMACVPAHAGTQAGSCTVTATMSGSSLLQTFHLFTVAGPASQLLIEGGNLQTAAAGQTFADPLLVRVTDAWGNPVSGTYVDLNDSNPLHGWHAWSDAQGLAGTIWPAGTVAGPLSVTAGIPENNAQANVVFHLTVMSGTPSSITVASDAGQSAVVGEAFGAPLVALVRDVQGNPVSGATITWSAPGSGATAALGTPSPTNASGQASISATAGVVAGSYTVTASINGGAAHTDFALMNSPDVASVFAYSGLPASPVAGSAFGFTVVARDAYGNVATGYRGTVAFTSTDAAATLPMDYTFASGDAGSHLFNVTMRSTGGRLLTASDTAAPIAGTSPAIDVRPGAPAEIRVVEGAGQHARVNTEFAMPIVVQLLDSWDNPVPGATVRIVPMGSAGYPPSWTLQTESTGEADTTLMAGTAAGTFYAFFHTDNGVWITIPFTNDPGEPAAVVAVSGSPQSATVATAFAEQLAVQVEDAYGNEVPAVTVSYSLPPDCASASLSAAAAVTGDSGQAAVDAAALEHAGTCIVTASTGGFGTPFTLTSLPGAPAIMTAFGGNGQSVRVGEVFTSDLAARVADTFGNLIPAAPVVWSTPRFGPSAVLRDLVAAADSSGNATTRATAGREPGVYTVAVASVEGAASTSFSLTNLAAPTCPSGSSCGCEGTCDGEGTCRPSARGTYCGGSGTYCDSRQECDGNGACVATAPVAGDPICSRAPGDMAVNRTVPTQLAWAADFLWAGANPQQLGVAHGVIDPLRVAVVRGAVRDVVGLPMPGVMVSVLGRTEFGAAMTQADGTFALAVNGGGSVTLQYDMPLFPPVQRTVGTAPQQYSWAEDVVLVDEVSGPDVDFGWSSAQLVTSGDATLVLARDTLAELRMPDGATLPAAELDVNITPLPLSSIGSAVLPGEAPPETLFAFAADLSSDFALGSGAADVVLSREAALYVAPAADLPVGSALPAGWFDRAAAHWVASDNGMVVRVTGTAGGAATLDLDGDDLPEGEATLAAAGIYSEECLILAARYSQPTTLWRLPVDRLAPWAAGFPYALPADATAPHVGMAEALPRRVVEPTEIPEIGEIENRILGQRIDVPGIPFPLEYRSDRTKAWSGRVAVPLTDTVVPESLAAVEVSVEIAGRRETQRYTRGSTPALAPGLQQVFVWDGKDAWGRNLQGSQPFRVSVTWEYPASWRTPGSAAHSFGLASDASPLAAAPSLPVRVTQTTVGELLGTLDAAPLGLGGWMLSVHHVYDPQARVLYMGDGRRRAATPQQEIVRAVGGPFDRVGDLAFGPDGALYFTQGGALRTMDSAGTVRTVALGISGSIDVAPDGAVIACTRGGRRVLRVRGPVVETIAGNGEAAPSGSTDEGMPATQVGIGSAWPCAAGPDGSVYFSDSERRRVRKVGTDGRLHTVAYAPESTELGNGGPYGIAVGPDGSVYFSDRADGRWRIRRIAPDGVVSIVAGDGGPANTAQIWSAGKIAVDRDGGVYFLDMPGSQPMFPDPSKASRLLRIGPDGILRTVVGGTGLIASDGRTCAGVSEHGAQAKDYRFSAVAGPAWGDLGSFAIGPSGAALYDCSHRISRIESAFPGVQAKSITIPSEDASEAYVFSPSGRHLRTVDARTGATRLTFGYDEAGRLASVTDAFGNITSVEYDASGRPSALAGPHGRRVTLATDGDGNLSDITDASLAHRQFGYDVGGLLATHTDPVGALRQFAYEPDGRLSTVTDPGGQTRSLVDQAVAGGFAVALTDPVTGTAVYARLPARPGEMVVGPMSPWQNPPGAGDELRTISAPDGTTEFETVWPDGSRWAREADRTQWGLGRTIDWTQDSWLSFGPHLLPDPTFGWLAPIDATYAAKTPAGHLATTTASRTAAHDDSSNPARITGIVETNTANGKTTTTTLDLATHTEVIRSPLGRTRTTVLDAQGRAREMRIPGLATTTFGFDSRGRPESVVQGTRTLAFTYNAHGLAETVTDALGRVGGYTYDDADRVGTWTPPGGTTLTYSWDPAGHLLAVTPAKVPAQGYMYAPLDLPEGVGEVSPNDGNIRAFDAAGNVTEITRPDGTSVYLGYDGAGRLSTVIRPAGTWTYTYDPVTGRMNGVTGPGGGMMLSHDGALPTGMTWSGAVSGSVGTSYRDDLRVGSTTVNGGNEVSFGYDDDGLVTSAGTMTLARDPGNGAVIGSWLGNVTDSRTDDEYGQLHVYSARFGSTVLYSATYEHDALGRLSSKTETVEGETHTTVYTYDGAGRLEEVTRDGSRTAHYEYDAAGNRLSRTTDSATDAGTCEGDRLLSYRGSTFTYTANGERWTKTDAATGETTTFGYDDLGNLVRVDLPDGRRIDYVIDAGNRRIGKKVDGTLVQGLLWGADGRIAAETDGTGNVVSRFVYATEDNAPDFMVKGGQTYRMVKDHLGSPRLVVDASSGAVAQRVEYDEFGGVVSETGSGFQPFGFAGALRDSVELPTLLGGRAYDAAGAVLFQGPPIHILSPEAPSPNRSSRSGFYSSTERATRSRPANARMRRYPGTHDGPYRLSERPWRDFFARRSAAVLPGQMDDSLPTYVNAVAVLGVIDLWQPRMLDAKGKNVTPPDGHITTSLPALGGIIDPVVRPGCTGPYGCSWGVTAHQYRLRRNGYSYAPCTGLPACLTSPILGVPGAEWHLPPLDDGAYHWQMRAMAGISPSAWSDETEFVLDTTPPLVPNPWVPHLTRYFDSRIVRVTWDALTDLSGIARYLVAVYVERQSAGPPTVFDPESDHCDADQCGWCDATECHWVVALEPDTAEQRRHYRFQVAAVDGAGNQSEWSDESDFAIHTERPDETDDFLPFPCQNTPDGSTEPFLFSTDELPGSLHGTLGTSWYTTYARGINYMRRFIGNCFTNQVRVDFDRFETAPDEPPTASIDASTNLASWSGALGAFSTLMTIADSFQVSPLRLWFSSAIRNTAQTNRGFSIAHIGLGCSDTCSDQTVSVAFAGERYDGYLQGPGDVVYLAVDPADARHIHLWGAPSAPGGAGRDFDLFARCRSLPTPDAFYRASARPGTSEESILLPADGCVGTEAMWFVAVHSRMGKGQFRLFVFDAPQLVNDELDVGTTFVMTANEASNAREVLRNALKQWYSVTQGRIYFGPSIRFWNDGSCDCGSFNHCELCFEDYLEGGSYRSHSSRSWAETQECSWLTYYYSLYPQITICRDAPLAGGPPFWYWEKIMHEMGHFAFHLPDEYDASGQVFCGHTFMGDQYRHMIGLCNARNHLTDPDAGAVTPSCNIDGYTRLGIEGVTATQEYALFAGSGQGEVDVFDPDGFEFNEPTFSVVEQQ